MLSFTRHSKPSNKNNIEPTPTKDSRFVARIILIAAIIAIIVADMFEQPVAIRITALFMIVACGSYLAYFYMPCGVRVFFSNIANIISILVMVGVIVYSLLTARNKIWLYSFIFYMIVSMSAYIVNQIQQYRSVTAGSRKNDLIYIGIWCVTTVYIWIDSYCLFESDLPFFQSIPAIVYVQLVVMIIALVYLIRTGSIISRIGYCIVCLSLLFCGVIYYLPANHIIQWELFCIGAILSATGVLFLSYICIKGIPAVESFLDPICILFIIRGVTACTELPEIRCQLQLFFNS